MAKRMTSVLWCRAILRALAEAGVAQEALLTAAGIDPSLFDDPEAQIASDQLSALWESAARLSGNPHIGLIRTHVARPGNFDIAGYTMISAPTLLAAMKGAARYYRILSQAVALDLFQQGGDWVLTLAVFGEQRPVPRQRVEFILLMLVMYFRWMTETRLRPVRVEFAQPEPADRRPYEAAFEAPLVFGAPVNALVYSHADVTLPLPTSYPELADFHERIAGERLSRLDQTRTASRVRDQIIRRLHAGLPKRNEVAGALCISERTLQRRLTAEGTSYQDILDQTRRDLTRDYLGRQDLALAQVAYLVGFADQGNFFRACRRWFGMPPRQFRAKLLAG